VVPGDLLLVTPIPGDALGELVTLLDGSRFCHAGIAWEDGKIASCRSSPSAFDPDDSSGVRIDDLSEFTKLGREVWKMRVAPELRLPALEFVEAFADDGAEGAPESSFSFAKLFVVSAALNALDPHNEVEDEDRDRMLDAAVDAAEAYAWSPERPRFFCSDFVACAYGVDFPLSTLRPPAGPRPDPVPEPPVRSKGHRIEPPSWGDVEAFMRAVGDEFPTGRQALELWQLLARVARHDTDYFAEAIDVLIAKLAHPTDHGPADHGPRSVGRPSTRPPAGDARYPTPRIVAPGMAPTALVTPRMLLQAGWTSDLTPVVRP
jgi:hypothetical protein